MEKDSAGEQILSSPPPTASAPSAPRPLNSNHDADDNEDASSKLKPKSLPPPPPPLSSLPPPSASDKDKDANDSHSSSSHRYVTRLNVAKSASTTTRNKSASSEAHMTTPPDEVQMMSLPGCSGASTAKLSGKASKKSAMNGSSSNSNNKNNKRTKEETPFICRVEGCFLRATRIGNLLEHDRTHSDQRRPYSCAFCPQKKSKTTREILKHLDKKHQAETGATVPKTGYGRRATLLNPYVLVDQAMVDSERQELQQWMESEECRVKLLAAAASQMDATNNILTSQSPPSPPSLNPLIPISSSSSSQPGTSKQHFSGPSRLTETTTAGEGGGGTGLPSSSPEQGAKERNSSGDTCSDSRKAAVSKEVAEIMKECHLEEEESDDEEVRELIAAHRRNLEHLLLNEYPYACRIFEECAKEWRFANEDDRHAHEREHYPYKPYQCTFPVVAKSFRNPGTGGGETSNNTAICNTLFIREQLALDHIREVHCNNDDENVNVSQYMNTIPEYII